MTFLYIKSDNIPGILWRHTDKVICAFSGQSMRQIVKIYYVYFAHCRRWFLVRFLNAFKDRYNLSFPSPKKTKKTINPIPPTPRPHPQPQCESESNTVWLTFSMTYKAKYMKQKIIIYHCVDFVIHRWRLCNMKSI